MGVFLAPLDPARLLVDRVEQGERHRSVESREYPPRFGNLQGDPEPEHGARVRVPTRFLVNGGVVPTPGREPCLDLLDVGFEGGERRVVGLRGRRPLGEDVVHGTSVKPVEPRCASPAWSMPGMHRPPGDSGCHRDPVQGSPGAGSGNAPDGHPRR